VIAKFRRRGGRNAGANRGRRGASVTKPIGELNRGAGEARAMGIAWNVDGVTEGIGRLTACEQSSEGVSRADFVAATAASDHAGDSFGRSPALE